MACKHNALFLIATGTKLRAYGCEDCKQISLIVGGSVDRLIAFHSIDVLSETIKNIREDLKTRLLNEGQDP